MFLATIFGPTAALYAMATLVVFLLLAAYFGGGPGDGTNTGAVPA